MQAQVDADLDSAVSSNSSNSSNSGSDDDDGEHDDKWLKPPMLPVVEEDAKPKETRCCTVRESRGTIWQSDYFYIPEAAPDATGLRIRMRPSVSLSEGIGKDCQSKYITPSLIGETMESCPVTLLLLRAWSIWRAHRDGWASSRPCRKRQIDEDLSRLQRDVQNVLTQNGGSLGHKKADALWASLERQCPVLAQ